MAKKRIDATTARATLNKSRNEKEVWKCGKKWSQGWIHEKKNEVFQRLPVWPNKMEFSPRHETLEYTFIPQYCTVWLNFCLGFLHKMRRTTLSIFYFQQLWGTLTDCIGIGIRAEEVFKKRVVEGSGVVDPNAPGLSRIVVVKAKAWGRIVVEGDTVVEGVLAVALGVIAGPDEVHVYAGCHPGPDPLRIIGWTDESLYRTLLVNKPFTRGAYPGQSSRQGWPEENPCPQSQCPPFPRRRSKSGQQSESLRNWTCGSRWSLEPCMDMGGWYIPSTKLKIIT